MVYAELRQPTIPESNGKHNIVMKTTIFFLYIYEYYKTMKAEFILTISILIHVSYYYTK